MFGGLPNLLQLPEQERAALVDAMGGPNGDTPLTAACQYGHLAVVAVLLKCQANVNVENVDGHAPRFIAAHHGHACIVSLLLGANANADGSNASKYTPLLAAAYGGQVEIAALLLRNGAGVDTADPGVGSDPDDVRVRPIAARADRLRCREAARICPATASAAASSDRVEARRWF